ncbi:MAG: class IV adenylate cyclase [Nitrososphaeria archaeon]|jgi:adenylate cyclase class 2
MPLEREVKLKVPEDVDLESFLLRNGGFFLKKEKQIDVYLDFDDFKIKKSGSAFRIRFSGNYCFLTFKGPQKEDIVKNREEYEVMVSDGEQLLKILKSIGLDEKLRIAKERTTIGYEGLNFEIDVVEGLGKFVEIEIKSDNDIQKVKTIIEKAGILWSPILKSYAELLTEKHI